MNVTYEEITDSPIESLEVPKQKRKYTRKPKEELLVVPPVTPPGSSDEDEPVEPVVAPIKQKRVQTDKQRASFEVAKAKRAENIAKRKELREIQKEAISLKNEERLVKKGIALKKADLIRQVLDDSDFEVPDEIIKKVLQKKTSRKSAVKSEPVEEQIKYKFVE